MFAWCGISQSMSATPRPAAATVSRATESSTDTASLNTAGPSIVRNGCPVMPPPDTFPAVLRMCSWLPSACSFAARMPGLSPAASTTAPAPSPNSTQVPRSFQSRIRENTSVPMTSAFVAIPLRIIASAVAIP